MTDHMKRLKAMTVAVSDIAALDWIVNSHDALVAALEACVENFGPCLTTADAGLPTVIKTIGEAADCHAAIKKARAALKLAEDGT